MTSTPVGRRQRVDSLRRQIADLEQRRDAVIAKLSADEARLRAQLSAALQEDEAGA